MTAKHTTMGGEVNLYKRPRSNYWQCATYLAGRNWRKSTKESDIRKAKDFAEGWYLDLRARSRVGELLTEKTFAYAAKQFKREYTIITQGDRNAEYVEGMMARLDNYIIPFLGHKGLSQVTPGLVQEYRIHRQGYSKPRHNNSGEHIHKPPARSTMHQEIVALRQVLKTAIRHGWLTHLPDLSMPYKTSGKIVRRAWFSQEEYKQLFTATRNNIGKAVNSRHKKNAEQLHDLVLFMANTGLRPDEILRLEYRDITIVDDLDSGETAYSLRHTYICLRLMEGADIYQIAKNCRTSVEMIEKYYASHIKTLINAAQVNVRRRKPFPVNKRSKRKKT